jgi:dATP pyrophosphohydrolase
MEGRHKKVQIVVAAPTPSGVWSCLILKRNRDGGGIWQNVTGSVEKDETFEDGALRETQEETALPIENIVDIRELGLIFNFVDRWKRKVEERTFLIVSDKQWKPTLDPKEHDDWKWVNLDEISPELLEWPSNREALMKASRILRRTAA